MLIVIERRFFLNKLIGLRGGLFWKAIREGRSLRKRNRVLMSVKIATAVRHATYVSLSVYLAQHSRGSKEIRLDSPSKIMHRETDSIRTMLSLVHCESESEVLVELRETDAEIAVSDIF